MDKLNEVGTLAEAELTTQLAIFNDSGSDARTEGKIEILEMVIGWINERK